MLCPTTRCRTTSQSMSRRSCRTTSQSMSRRSCRTTSQSMSRWSSAATAPAAARSDCRRGGNEPSVRGGGGGGGGSTPPRATTSPIVTAGQRRRRFYCVSELTTLSVSTDSPDDQSRSVPNADMVSSNADTGCKSAADADTASQLLSVSHQLTRTRNISS